MQALAYFNFSSDWRKSPSGGCPVPLIRNWLFRRTRCSTPSIISAFTRGRWQGKSPASAAVSFHASKPSDLNGLSQSTGDLPNTNSRNSSGRTHRKPVRFRQTSPWRHQWVPRYSNCPTEASTNRFACAHLTTLVNPAFRRCRLRKLSAGVTVL